MTLIVGDQDPELQQALSDGLDAYNLSLTGYDDQRALSVKALDADSALIGGLRGWTWGTCAGITMLWVREDQRRHGWGARFLAAAETEARSRGCAQIIVSSFTFQAPEFYERNGYVETGRTPGIPTAEHADVHLRKLLG